MKQVSQMLEIELRGGRGGDEVERTLGEGKSLEASSSPQTRNVSPLISGFSQFRISSESYRKRFSRKSKIDGGI